MFAIPWRFLKDSSPARPRTPRAAPRLERLEGRALPSFLPAAHLPLGGAAGAPLPGDFNGDGDPDVLVTGPAARLLLGNGDGTFQEPLALGPGIRPTQVGDFNGDGLLDLAGPATDSVAVWLGNGDGSFRAAVHSPLAIPSDRLAAGDLNGDGALDLVAGTVDGYDGILFIRVLLGNGDGTFQAAVGYRAGQQFGHATVTDVDGDGAPDVVGTFYKVGGFGGIGSTFPDTETGWYVSVWRGNGDGTLRPQVDTRLADQAGGAVAGDFNGDGVLDVAVPYLGSEYTGWSTSRVDVLLGNGDGTFPSALTHFVHPHARPLSLAAADFNRDGVLDLAVANWEFSYDGDTPVTVLPGNGDGTFRDALHSDAHRGRQWLSVADFNRDGFPDVVVYNSTSGDVSVLINAADWQPE